MMTCPDHHCETVQRRGIALMLVMVAVLITGGMAVAYFGSRDNSISISENIETATVARVSGGTGLDLAVAILETNADWRTSHVDGVILNEYQIGQSVISITVLDSETQSPPTISTNQVEITVHSSVGDVSQISQATATIVPDNEEFDVDFSEFAIFAQSSIQIRDVASIDFWSASPSVQQSNELQIGTLSTGPMSIDMQTMRQGRSLNAHTVERASSMFTSAQFDRTTFTDTPTLPSPPPAPEPEHVEQLQIDSHQVNWHNSWRQGWTQQFSSGQHHPDRSTDNYHVVTEGAYEAEDFILGNGQTMLIEGDVSINILGDVTIRNASIVLTDDATLALFVEGDVSFHSSYIGNEDRNLSSYMDPSRCQLFGTDESTWKVNGHSTLKGELYAPESFVSMSGNSTVCGRIAADDVLLRGASRLLYDQTLDNGGYADHESALYDEDGFLVSGLSNLDQLDPVLIDAIRSASIDYLGQASVNDVFGNGQWIEVDWRVEPTARPHEVIYIIKVVGIDARVWEIQAIAHQHNTNQFAGIYD